MINVRNVILANPEWGMKLVLTVHDEIVCEVYDEYIEQATEAMEDAMVHAVELDVPVEVDMGVGKTYSEAK
jgi:DNA polymerase-1